MRAFYGSWLAALALLVSTPGSTLARSGDAAKLIGKVESVAHPGIPGPAVVFGKRAFAVVEGALSGGGRASAITAGALSSGRALAFGHNGYMSAATAKVGETETLARKLAMCAPSNVVRELDDPQSSMELSDRALDAMANVAGRSRERERPERVVCQSRIRRTHVLRRSDHYAPRRRRHDRRQQDLVAAILACISRLA